jgi:outer membrane protein assembly factor BamC
MVENYATAQKDRTIWQARPSDPELEIEFLRRLMVKLGTSPQEASAAVTAPTAPAGVPVVMLDGQPTINLNEAFDRAWRRTGVALDRSGFTVEDRDMAAGRYFVRYVAPQTNQSQPGFISRLFSSKKEQSVLACNKRAVSYGKFNGLNQLHTSSDRVISTFDIFGNSLHGS